MAGAGVYYSCMSEQSHVLEARELTRHFGRLREADLVRLVRRLDILRTRLETIEARGWARSRRRGQA